MKRIIFLFVGLALLTFKDQAQTVTDIDGNVYNTVTIGIQIWMKENLKVTHYNNGDSIPNVIDDIQWGNQTIGAYCDNNNNLDTTNIYGRLYNWYTVVDSRNLCPVGWHVPTDTEWSTLITYLGGDSVAGDKMKEAGTTHWANPNTGATNESGFKALPGGNRNMYGDFLGIGYGVHWFSSTEVDVVSAWTRSLIYTSPEVYRLDYGKKNGFSVRCVKNSASSINNLNFMNILKIYPNPAIDKFYIDCAQKQDMKIQIYNMIGECILQRELNKYINEIDICFLTKGIFLVKVSGTDWTVQSKLIKE
jgi:uncharacterized protein (TIGR02145 family)